ncbi:hypothetical protein HPB49_003848 [Dermacentor silvarum]|uniref:Uncharacterized protein n=1 Tax=Dermacentor silvarum TaxID=543639 RepID=A0ACB8CPP5_DERSI|nr:hypothetical protein HPB49_003848 [Dermacentor silvarum]
MAHKNTDTVIWQWNCRGYRHKQPVLRQHLRTSSREPDVLILQETHDTPITLPGYQPFIAANAPHGVSTLVRQRITAIEHDLHDRRTEHLFIELIPHKKRTDGIFILNIDNAPSLRHSRFLTLFKKALNAAGSSPLVIGGDFSLPHTGNRRRSSHLESVPSAGIDLLYYGHAMRCSTRSSAARSVESTPRYSSSGSEAAWLPTTEARVSKAACHETPRQERNESAPNAAPPIDTRERASVKKGSRHETGSRARTLFLPSPEVVRAFSRVRPKHPAGIVDAVDASPQDLLLRIAADEGFSTTRQLIRNTRWSRFRSVDVVLGRLGNHRRCLTTSLLELDFTFGACLASELLLLPRRWSKTPQTCVDSPSASFRRRVSLRIVSGAAPRGPKPLGRARTELLLSRGFCCARPLWFVVPLSSAADGVVVAGPEDRARAHDATRESNVTVRLHPRKRTSISVISPLAFFFHI